MGKIVLLIVGFMLIGSSIVTPIGAYIKDRIRGRKRKLIGFIIVSVIILILGIVAVLYALNNM